MCSESSDIYLSMNRKSSDELLDILRTADYNTWSDLAFKAAYDVLRDREVEVDSSLMAALNQKNSAKRTGQDIFSKSYNFIVLPAQIISTAIVAVYYVLDYFYQPEKFLFAWAAGAILGAYFGSRVFFHFVWNIYLRIKNITVEECLTRLQSLESSSDSKHVRQGSLEKLCFMSSESNKALKAVFEVLGYKHLDTSHKGTALRAIRKTRLDAVQFAGQLLHLFESNDPQLVRELVKTLTEITGQRFGDDVEKWQQWLRNRSSALN